MTEKKVYKYAIIIASDSRSTGEKQDLCIDAIKEALPSPYEFVDSTIVPDDVEALIRAMQTYISNEEIDLVWTSGGTGFSARDNTPEATREVIQKETPGLSEAIRLFSKEKTDHWMLSRAISGIADSTLIINLPGSPKAVKESVEAVLPALGHGLDIMIGSFTQHD